MFSYIVIHTLGTACAYTTTKHYGCMFHLKMSSLCYSYVFACFSQIPKRLNHMLCDVICDHSYFVTSSMIIQSRSNCDVATGNILRQHYQRPYFLPRSAESSKTDWIFMGSPGYGAHMHVSGHVLFS